MDLVTNGMEFIISIFPVVSVWVSGVCAPCASVEERNVPDEGPSTVPSHRSPRVPPETSSSSCISREQSPVSSGLSSSCLLEPLSDSSYSSYSYSSFRVSPHVYHGTPTAQERVTYQRSPKWVQAKSMEPSPPANHRSKTTETKSIYNGCWSTPTRSKWPVTRTIYHPMTITGTISC